MSAESPETFDEFIEHCFIRLGKPVIDIEMTNEQARIAARDAITKFVEYHYQSTKKAWIKVEITEELMSSMKVTLPNNIAGVETLLSFKMNDFLYRTDSYGVSMWSILARNAFGPTMTSSKLDIFLYERELSDWENFYQSMPKWTFDKTTKEFTIEGGSFRMVLGSFLMIRATVDLTKTNGEIWQNSWLGRYGEALFRKQWSKNFQKFAKITLAGGNEIAAGDLRSQADEDIKELLEELYENSIFETAVVIG